MLKKVVIIDDNQTQLKILGSYFSKAEWEIISATNVDDALEEINKNAPDLIITDAIMPKTGGFELLKKLREDEKLIKIPVIMYSILTQNLAKLYIKEENGEYFLSKSENKENIIFLAKKAIIENPMTPKNKSEIIERYNTSKKNNNSNDEIINEQIKNIIIEKKIQNNFIFKIDENNLALLIRTSYASLMNDEKLPEEIFKILYPFLSYNLAVICFYDFKNRTKKICFDIKNFIFNPILQSYFITLFECNNTKLYKTYAPNSKTITSIKEFNSKIEFNFEYKQQKTASICFYSTKENIWRDEKSCNVLKQVLEDFFTGRYISKSSQNNIKKDNYNKYLGNNIDANLKNNFNPQKTKIGMYLGILNIANYKKIESELWEEDLDVLNSKISEIIINCISKDEQVEKTNDREYNIILLAQNNIEADKKFSIILSSLGSIEINEIKPNIVIGVSNCYTNDVFNINEAQKKARIALEKTSKENKLVIYAE